MATQIPIVFRLSPLPLNFSGTPQQLADAIVNRMSAESQNDIAFFVSGPVAPTSNVGPWLKDGVTWYVWDDVTAAYVPETLENLSLKYLASAPTGQAGTLTIVSGSNAVVGAGTAFTGLSSGDYISAGSETRQIDVITDDTHLTTTANWSHTLDGLTFFTATGAPDHTKYIFWIQLNSSGVAESVRYFSDGAWRDIYETKFDNIYSKSETDQKIIDSISIQDAGFSAYTSASQIIGSSDPSTVIQFNQLVFDDSADFDVTTYMFTAEQNGNYFFTASLRLDATTITSPTGITHVIGFRVNNISAAFDVINYDTNTTGPTPTISRLFKLTAGSTVKVYYQVTTATGFISMTVDNNSEATIFQGYRVK